MKRLFIALSLLAVLSSGCSTISSETKNMVNRPAPNVHFSILDGDYVSLNQYRGKTVVLLFWATWCHKSKDLIAKLSNYAKNYRGNPAEFIAVSIDRYEKLQTLKNMVYLQGFDGVTHAFSGNEVLDEAYLSFRLITVPTIVIIGEDGYVKAVGTDMDVVKKYTGGN